MTDLVDSAKNIKLNALGAAISHVSLHSAYPGTTGTTELTGGGYARQAVTWGSAAAGSMAASAALDFDVAAGSTVGWAGLWSASTGGTFRGSVPLGPVADPKIAAVLAADTFTAPAHGFSNGDAIELSKTLGALPTGTGLSDGAIVFVRDVATDTFKVATTLNGTAIDVTVGGMALVRRITTETFGGAGEYVITTLTINEA